MKEYYKFIIGHLHQYFLLSIILHFDAEMGTTYWNVESEHLDDEEVNHLSSKASELKCSEHPLVVEVKFPFPTYLSFVNYIRLGVSKYLEGYKTDLSEDKVSNPQRLLCRTTSLCNIPDKPRSSDSLIGNLKECRRTRSTNDHCDFFVEYASAAASGKVITSPSGQCIFDSVEGTVMATSLLKSSLFYQLGTPEIAIRPFRARSFSTSPLKICGISSSEAKDRNALSQEPENEVTSPIDQNSKLKASKSLDSCSIANSRSSYQLNPSSCPFVSKGLLRCVQKNGSLKILFSEEDDRGKVYVASSYKIESSSHKPLDYMYYFRLRTGNETSEFVGKMTVFSSLILHPNQSKITETEFVLFGAQEDRSREVQGCSSSSVEKSKGFSKKVADIFRPNQFSKHKPTSKAGEPRIQTETFLQNLCLGDAGNCHESELANHLKDGFPHNLELATIVVKSSQQDSNKEAAVGGWGLKFLEKVASNRSDASIDRSLDPESCEESHVNSQRSTKVLIPADIHGGPITGNDGPSSLTERWRSGHCDCGGWDLGCPLTVLHDAESSDSNYFFTEDMQENCKSVNFFIEGTKHGVPTLRMVNIGEGLYAMHFQRTLSALQAFSVGVAFIHSQTPALYPQF